MLSDPFTVKSRRGNGAESFASEGFILFIELSELSLGLLQLTYDEFTVLCQLRELGKESLPLFPVDL